jgi:hypothetical protein
MTEIMRPRRGSNVKLNMVNVDEVVEDYGDVRGGAQDLGCGGIVAQSYVLTQCVVSPHSKSERSIKIMIGRRSRYRQFGIIATRIHRAWGWPSSKKLASSLHSFPITSPFTTRKTSFIEDYK